jgi:hypothetical protein
LYALPNMAQQDGLAIAELWVEITHGDEEMGMY